MASLLGPTVAPHLVLGIPSSSNHDDAIRAFALRSRKVKTEPRSPFSMEDLTAALSEIEHGARDGAISLRYAVPCNPICFQPEASFMHNGAILTAQSSTDELTGILPSPDQNDRAGRTLLAAAVERLLDWRWEEASLLSRECLRISKDEDTRDESLNVLAASLAMQEDPYRAMQALQKAVEGRWNLSLQVNLAVIATKEDPAVASSQMSFIIDGAQSVEEKLRAARLAIRLWRESEGEDLDDDDRDPLAPQLLASIYNILTVGDLSEEDFFDLGIFLARVDSSDESLRGALDRSTFSDSLSAQVIRARRTGFGEYIDKLVWASARDRAHERPWLQEQVDSLVAAVNSRLADDITGDDIAMSMAFQFLENGLDCSDFQRIALRFLLELRLPEMIEDGSAPSDKFALWHSEARMAMANIGLSSEQLATLRDLDESAAYLLGAMVHRFNLNIGIQLEKAGGLLIERTRGFFKRMSADKDAVRSIQLKITSGCSDAIRSYEFVLPLVADADLKRDMTNTNLALRNLRDRISNLF